MVAVRILLALAAVLTASPALTSAWGDLGRPKGRFAPEENRTKALADGKVAPCLAKRLAPRWADLAQAEQNSLIALKWPEEEWNSMDIPGKLPHWKALDEEVRAGLVRGNDPDDPDGKGWDCFVEALRMRPEFPDTVALQQMQVLATPLGLDVLSPPGLETLRMAVYRPVWSALLSGTGARLFAGVWGVNVEFVRANSEEHADELLGTSQVDMMIGALELTPTGRGPRARPWRATDFGDLADTLIEHLYVTLPPADSPYAKVMRQDFFWTRLQDPEVLELLPHRRCSMGPWEKPDSGFGVWCLEPRKRVPVIWATGPQTDSMQVKELMAFINSKGLPFGIDFLEPARMMQKAYLASASGRPAIFLVEEPSQMLDTVEPWTQRVHLPNERDQFCGSTGNWTNIGQWQCSFVPRRLAKLGRQGLHPAVQKFLEKFDIHDPDAWNLFRYYREEYQGSLDAPRALSRAQERWVHSNEHVWKDWFEAPEGVTLSEGRILFLGILGMATLGWFYGEIKRKKSGKIWADQVDRSERVKIPLEILAGTMDTINIMLRGVGMAAVICSAPELQAYQGIALKHVIVGHWVAQMVTLVFSRYETPLHTPSIEILPLLKTISGDLSAKLVGFGSESVMITVLICSMASNLISGFLLFLIGKLEMGGALRFMPYAVEIGVQGALGVVLLDLAFEAACGESALELLSEGKWRPVVEWETSMLWIPSFVSAIGIFVWTKKIVDSPYTIVIYMVMAIGGFHTLRFILGAGMEQAREHGWLYPEGQDGTIFSLYSMNKGLIYWAALAEDLPSILVAVLIISVINCTCQLAVSPALLPPEIMGQSSFDDEMVTQGRSHILSGLFWGFSSDYATDDIMVHRMFGGRYRLGMYVHVTTLFLCILWGEVAKWTLPYIPKFVNGTIILLAALEFLIHSIVHGSHQLVKTEFAIVLVMIITVITTGGRMEVSLAAGIFLGLVEFVVKYARSTDTPTVRVIPGAPGAAAVELQGYLFFATAARVVEAVLDHVDGLPGERKVLVVNMGPVTGLDTKASQEFRRLRMRPGLRVILCGPRTAVSMELKRGGVLPGGHGHGHGDSHGAPAPPSIQPTALMLDEPPRRSKPGSGRASIVAGRGSIVEMTMTSRSSIRSASAFPARRVGESFAAADLSEAGINSQALNEMVRIAEESPSASEKKAAPAQGHHFARCLQPDAFGDEHSFEGPAWPIVVDTLAIGEQLAIKMLKASKMPSTSDEHNS